MAKKKVVDTGVTLAMIVAATLAGTIIYTFKEEYEPLVAAGTAEINPAMTDPSNEEAVATRATQAGIDLINSGAGDSLTPTPVVKKEKVVFNIAANIPVPESGARSGRETVYPFDKLEVGQSFFVPNSEERPEAAKSLTSTISSAHNRFSVPDSTGKTRVVMKGKKKGETVPVMVKTRTFSIRNIDGASWGFPGVMGAGIWRTA